MSAPTAKFHYDSGSGEGVTKMQWEPGATSTVDQKGRKTATETGSCIWAARASISDLPVVGQAHRDDATLFVNKIQRTRLEGDIAQFKVDYEGLEMVGGGPGGGGGALPAPSYSLSITTADEPIDSHPKFKDFGTVENGAFFDPESDTFKYFKAFLDAAHTTLNPKGGIRSYRSPRVVWRMKYMVTTRPSGHAGTGKIGTPSGGAPDYNSESEPATNFNWLTGPMTYQERSGGAVFEVSIEWELSGPRGWDADIYG